MKLTHFPGIQDAPIKSTRLLIYSALYHLAKFPPRPQTQMRHPMNITKKTITLAFIALPAIAFADAAINNGNAYDDLSRINAELNKSKTELNSTYQKLYLSTRYKNELQQAQEAWLAYRSKQCTGYVAAEASASQGIGSSLITKECLTTITKQRVDYLKTLLQK